MKILGYTYTLKRDIAVNNSNASGLFDPQKLEICLPVDTQPDQIETTAILHEVIEALNAHLELDMPHRVIACLEAGLYQVMTDNGVDLSPLKAEMQSSKSSTPARYKLAARKRGSKRA